MYHRVIIFIVLCLTLCSCGSNQVGVVNRSFDEKCDQVLANIHGSTYYGIEDAWIDKVDTVKRIGAGYGLLVHYHYGRSERTCCFYQDPDGKVAPAYRGEPKSSGYPSLTDMTYKINNEGYIVFDWVAEIMVLAGCLLVLLWAFVSTPS